MQLLLLSSECWKMEEHREAGIDPNVVEAGGSAQCGAEIPACHLKYKLKEYSWSSLAEVSWGCDTVFV